MVIFLSKDFNKQLVFLKIAGFALIPLILWLLPFDKISAMHSICLYKSITGHECYGCGMTRAILSALHFRLTDAFHYNKLIIIVLPLLLWIWFKTLYSYFNDLKNFRSN